MSISHPVRRSVVSIACLSVAVSVGAAACGPANYDGPAHFPETTHGHVGEILTIGGSVSPQGGFAALAPAPAPISEARCADDSICEVLVEEGRAYVGGKAPGKTEVLVRYTHPTSKVVGEARVAVSIGAARTRRLIEVGPRKDGTGKELTLLPDAPGGGEYSCEIATVDPGQLETGRGITGYAAGYVCHEPLAMASGARYFGRAHPGKDQKGAFVCIDTTTRGADTAAVWVYEIAGGNGAGKLVGTRGDGKSGVCARAKPQ
jgi:hypothetical protein